MKRFGLALKSSLGKDFWGWGECNSQSWSVTQTGQLQSMFLLSQLVLYSGSQLLNERRGQLHITPKSSFSWYNDITKMTGKGEPFQFHCKNSF